MRKKYAVEIISSGLLQQPAVNAWRELLPGSPEPTGLAVLKDRVVYRIDGVGPGGSSVVAKACPQTYGRFERSIYEDVLPRLGLTSVRCYGFINWNGNESGWLFLEDAGDEKYCANLDEHRILGARWLGALHASAHRARHTSAFPDRDLSYYLDLVRRARAGIMANRTNPALGRDHVALLDAIVGQGHFLESHWSVIERSCAWMPRSLVHGDFVTKNLRLRPGPIGMSVLPLDWETAGWGIICPDLVMVDLPTYSAVVQDTWPNMDLDAVCQMAQYGMLFRRISSICWAAAYLPHPWLERIMRHLESHYAEIDKCIRAAGLSE